MANTLATQAARDAARRFEAAFGKAEANLEPYELVDLMRTVIWEAQSILEAEQVQLEKLNAGLRSAAEREGVDLDATDDIDLEAYAMARLSR